MRHPRRGLILITTLLVLTGMAAFGGATLMRSLNEVAIAHRSLASQQAFYLAEAGVDWATQWLAAQPAPPTCPFLVPGDPASGCDPTFTLATPFPGPQSRLDGSYTVTIDPDDMNPTNYLQSYTIRAVGTTSGLPTTTRALTFTLRTESFSRYAYFEGVDNVQDPWWQGWWTGNPGDPPQNDGPMHLNGRLYIINSPRFAGPVSTVYNSWVCAPGYTCNPVFEQGLTLGVAPIPMPTDPAIDTLKANAGLVLDGNTTVTLQGDTLFVTNAAQGWTNEPVAVTGQAVFVENGNLTVTGGELNGQLTLASRQDIFIEGNLLYTCDPQQPQFDADCLNPVTGQIAYNDDILGLVARHEIRFARSAPYDLTIQATLMAVTGVIAPIITFEDLYNPKGDLNTFGSVVSYYGLVPGLFFGGDPPEIVAGYSGGQNIYDTRLRTLVHEIINSLQVPKHGNPMRIYEPVY